MHPNRLFHIGEPAAMAAMVRDLGFGTLVAPTPDGLYYDTTLLWEPKTFITDERTLMVPEETVLEPGEGYTLVVGMYPLSDQSNRVEVSVNGKPWGTEYRLNEALSSAAEEE